MPLRAALPAVLSLVLLAGAAGCGGDEPKAAPSKTPAASASQPGTTPSTTPAPNPSATLSTTPGAVAKGLPAGFPTTAVPVVSGVVSASYGGDDPAPEGRKGWVLEVRAPGTATSCFDDAVAALVARGYTKQGEMTAADTRQAQLTSADYAVIVSAREADDTGCVLGYEVGQIAK